jgi:hypothetical protein
MLVCKFKKINAFFVYFDNILYVDSNVHVQYYCTLVTRNHLFFSQDTVSYHDNIQSNILSLSSYHDNGIMLK